MSRKTNKTARVLSLITNGNPDAQSEEQISEPLQEKNPIEANPSPAPESLTISPSEPMIETKTEPKIEHPNSSYIIGRNSAEESPEIASPTIEPEKTDDNKTEENEMPSGQFKKLMSQRLQNTVANKNPAPIVEILFNDHDPLSDMIRDQLQAEEAMAEAVQKKGNVMREEEKNMEIPEEISPAIPFVSRDASSGTVTIKTTDGAESDELDYKFVNVFEEIVRSQVLEAMQNFGVCTCDRCIVDVVALTVTNLPAKCIVADKGAIFPLLSYYSSKYTTQVQTELVKACVKVKENPHHKL
ncbi:MAG: late competence development ComFB family protein [Peptostreptococcaceae bacterium]|nr:late competence development ComFB family protein [Peptostreptococcaceae bacterium]